MSFLLYPDLVFIYPHYTEWICPMNEVVRWEIRSTGIHEIGATLDGPIAFKIMFLGGRGQLKVKAFL